MKETFLFVVEIAFQITGRGCVLAPGAPTKVDSPIVRPGCTLRLQTPEGESIHTRVKGIEMLNVGRARPERTTAPILLPKEITKDLVPAGTKVFLLQEAADGA